MSKRDLALLLVRKGVANQKREADDYTEANEDSEIKSFGNAAIANTLEFLGGHGIVVDVQPSFSGGGLGFAYRIDPSRLQGLSDEELLKRAIDTLFEGPMTETATTLAELLNKCERATVNDIYRDDLLASIKELRLCFTAECYIACLALSGKLLEICLKQVLINNNIEFEDKWMLGRLIGKLQDSHVHVYLDQSLADLAKIINKSRIPAVHSGTKIPVPSKDQAIMVIHAVVDTVNRVIANP